MFKHGKSKSKAYSSWSGIIQRTTNEKDKRFKDYGGRGIEVCERWRTFENFLADIGEPPSPQHSVDRINNNGNYEPSNCRWATPKEQANNKKDTILITYNGETKNIFEWADSLNIKHHTLYYRYLRGWPIEKIMTQKLQNKGVRHKQVLSLMKEYMWPMKKAANFYDRHCKKEAP